MHRSVTPTVNGSSCAPATQDSEDIKNKDDFHSSKDSKPFSDELPPSLQLCVIKVEQIPVLEETQIQLQVKEEQEDQCISPDVEADTSHSAAVKHVKSEPTDNCELFPSPSGESVNNNNNSNKWNDSDVSPHRSVEVCVELEQPPREEDLCHICGKSFKRDSYLIRHVNKFHKGQKAFKCLQCHKQFDQRFQLVLHVRTHTGENPFSCDHCGEAQNSNRLAHSRVHTGEEPYFCAKCGKSFATSNHVEFSNMQNEDQVAPEELRNEDESHKEEKAFKCSECSKEFDKKHHLIRHMRVHTGEKPFSCDFCGKSFTQNSNRVVHMRRHTGEKPYSCDKCGKKFASRHHLKLCTGTQRKASDKLFRCMTCGRAFHTDSDLKLHIEVHKSWQLHISQKVQEHEPEEKRLKAV